MWWLPLATLGFIAAALFPFAIQAVIGVATVRSYVESGDPLAKIFRDAMTVFRREPALLLAPCVMMLSVLAGVVLLARSMTFAGLLLEAMKSGQLPTAGHADIVIALALPVAAAVLTSSVGLAVSNAVLADCFIERCLGRHGRLLPALGRVVARLPRLVLFTLLWSALLVVIGLVRLEVVGRTKATAGSLAALLVDFAFFALETGLVMAAYLMLVVMLREEVGPVEGMRRTLSIVKAEYGRTLAELVRLRLLDETATWASCALSVPLTAGLIYFGSPYMDGLSSDTQAEIIMGFMFGVMVSGMIGYYLCIQTLQLLLACSVYLFVNDGVIVDGFSRDDFEHVLCLKVSALPAGVTRGVAA